MVTIKNLNPCTSIFCWAVIIYIPNYLLGFIRTDITISAYLKLNSPSLTLKIHISLCAHSVVSDSVSLWTAAHKAPLSMEFSRLEYWSELPFPPPGNLSDPETESASPESSELAGRYSLPLSYLGSSLSLYALLK